MTTVEPDRLEAWFAKLEKLEEPKRTQMLTWVKQELAREKSLAAHANAAELAASLDPSWVITPANRLIAEAIEETIHTRRGRLLITCPPREGKTSLGGIWGVIRALQHHPEWRCMLVSFSSILAEESSVAARNLIAKHGSDAVDPLTGIEGMDELGLALAYDKAAAAAWRLRGHKGGLVAVGLGGTISGRHADCVSGDTIVYTERGPVTAERAFAEKHSQILAFDHDTDMTVWRNITASRRLPDRRTITMHTMYDRALRCTPEHLVCCDRGCETGDGEYVRADTLREGDAVFVAGGAADAQALVDPVTHLSESARCDVYDFQVEGTRNFFANGVLVHNCLIIDDPLKGMEAADSPTVKRHLIESFQGDLTTRLAPAAPIVLIQTRWATDDLAGFILKHEETLPPEQRRWRHINIPAQAEEGLYDSLGREPGEWLESALGRTPSDWQETKDIVGARVWASLYQGSPSPLEGGLVKKKWLEDHRLLLPPENPVLTVIGVDPCDSGHGDDAGIVAASLDDDGKVAMLADKSAPMTSDEWAKTAVALAVEVGASKIVVEAFAARETYRRVLDEAVTAAAPAYPIEIVAWPPIGSGRGGGDSLARSAALLQGLENGKTRLVGHFPTFETKATSWQSGQHQPDSLSALVVAHDELVHAGGLEWDIALPFPMQNDDRGDWMGRNI